MPEDHEKSTFEVKKLRSPAPGKCLCDTTQEGLIRNLRQGGGSVWDLPTQPHQAGLVFTPRPQRDFSELHVGCGCGEAEEKAAVLEQENLSEHPLEVEPWVPSL